MSWILLIAGLALWIAAHLYKRVAPDHRAALGSAGQGIVALAILASLAMMIFGYRWTGFIPIWSPPSFMIHINNLLMLVALYVYFSTMAASNLWIARIGHPQLAGFKIWAVAHLLVNGDLASIILFGGLLAWAVVSVIRINKESGPSKRERAPIKSEIVMAAVAVGSFVVITGLHTWAGKWPFAG